MRSGDFVARWLLCAPCIIGCDDPLVYPLNSPVVREAGAMDAGATGGVADASADAGDYDASAP